MMDWLFIGGRIQLAREARGVTQEELAGMIGANQRQISQWEIGKVKPGQDNLVKVCNALQTPPSFFFVNGGNHGNHK